MENSMNNVYEILLVGGAGQEADAVRRLLADAGGQVFRLHHADSLSAALDRLATRQIDAALIETSMPDSTALEAVSAIRIYAAAVPMLVLSGIDDEAMAYGAVRGGADDCLVKPRLDGPALARSIQYAIARHRRNVVESAAQESESPIIGVLGAKGGVGTTTVACHLSTALHQLSGGAVLLADMDFFGGQAGFLLRAQSAHTVADAAASVHRLDSDCWKAMVAQSPAEIDVLLAPGLDSLDEPPATRDVRHVLRIVRSWYSAIVVDLGCLNSLSSKLLASLTELLIVTAPEIQPLLGAKSVLAKLPEIAGAPEQACIILNRCSRRSTITPEEAERVLGQRVYAALSNNYGALALAYEAGQLLPARDELNRQFAALAAKLAGRDVKAPEPGRFSRLFRNVGVSAATACPAQR